MPSILQPNALTTVAAVQDEGTSLAALTANQVERAINAASAAIEQFVQRKLQAAARSYRLPYSGTLRLVLPDTPILSIASIVDDGDAADSATYRIEDADAGIIVADDLWSRRDLVVGIAQDSLPGSGEERLVVTATCGYVLPNDGGTRSLPYDIEQAAIITAVSIIKNRNADRRVASESLGDYSISYGGVNTAIGRGIGGLIPDEAAVMLMNHRRVVMA